MERARPPQQLLAPHQGDSLEKWRLKQSYSFPKKKIQIANASIFTISSVSLYYELFKGLVVGANCNCSIIIKIQFQVQFLFYFGLATKIFLILWCYENFHLPLLNLDPGIHKVSQAWPVRFFSSKPISGPIYVPMKFNKSEQGKLFLEFRGLYSVSVKNLPGYCLIKYAPKPFEKFRLAFPYFSKVPRRLWVPLIPLITFVQLIAVILPSTLPVWTSGYQI